MDDLIKFVIVLVVLAAIVIGLAYLSDSFTNWDVTTWFNFNAMSEGTIPSGDFAFWGCV